MPTVQEYAGGSPSGWPLAGAQDFGRFRPSSKPGSCPGLRLLDQVGFFAEHKIGIAAPEVPDPVCADAQRARCNMISGSTCTLMHPVTGHASRSPTAADRRLDLAIVVEMNTEALLSRDGQDDPIRSESAAQWHR